MVRNILNILSIGIILALTSLFFSYREVIPTPEDSSATFATGGFPIRAFEYPFPALGSNEIPSRMLLLFGLDLLFWIAVAAIVITLFPKIKDVLLKYHAFISTFGLIAIILHYLYLMIQFD